MKKQKAIESVWLAKTLSVILAVLILVAMYLVPTSAAELTADGASASTVAHSVNAEFTASIPAYVMPGEPGEVSADYTVTLENAVIPDNHELTAKVEYSGSMTEQNGVELPYVLTDATGNTIASGTKILTKSAGAPGDSVSISFGAALTAKARYAGVYADTAVFTFDTIEKVYTLDDINADAHLYGIGRTKPEFVIAKFNDDYSEVTVFKNGENSDGLPRDFTYTQGKHFSPMIEHKATLNRASITEGVVSITDYMFYGCSDLQAVDIAGTVKTITAQAFAMCSKLQNIVLPKSLQSIGGSAFYQCSALKSVEIPASVEKILGKAFLQCSALEKVTFNDGLKYVGDNAFGSCNLTDVTLPATVETLGTGAFGGNKIAYAYIPDNITSIGTIPFTSAYLTEITVSDGNDDYCSVDGVLYTKDMTKLISCPAKIDGERFVIPDGVAELCDYSFRYCQDIKELVIPESVIKISTSALNGGTYIHLTIIGKAGSYAETFAAELGYKFIAQ